MNVFVDYSNDKLFFLEKLAYFKVQVFLNFLDSFDVSDKEREMIISRVILLIGDKKYI